MIKHKAACTLELDEMVAMRAEISKLANQVAKMAMSYGHKMQQVQRMAICCEICGEGHTSDQYPVNPESIYYVGQQSRDNEQLRTDFRNLERQFEQVASNQNVRPTGSLPSDTEKNPIEHVQVINLRSGRELEESLSQRPVPERELVLKLVKEVENKDDEHMQEIEVRPPPPFPQRLQKLKDDSKYKNILDILSQVRMNLPLVEVLQEVPKYVKYLRDIVTNKRRLTECEIVALTEECSARVQMPGGIIEDVPIRVGKFIFSAAFIILYYLENKEVLIILGQPFLATGGAIIDVREEKLKMRVHNEEVTFNVYKALKLPKHFEDLCMISMVESKLIEQDLYVEPTGMETKIKLEKVVLRAECVKIREV
ncbi:uncharacterized protein [Nicotiana tomentosiformis]|uniref:uncharacterized protein n=1 Tax=Nicotiana tomentosiformis TaxID=4098 RepID=UPI00388C7A2F